MSNEALGARVTALRVGHKESLTLARDERETVLAWPRNGSRPFGQRDSQSASCIEQIKEKGGQNKWCELEWGREGAAGVQQSLRCLSRAVFPPEEVAKPRTGRSLEPVNARGH